MDEHTPFIVSSTEPRSRWLKAGLRDLYALALHEPLPEEWCELAKKIEAADSPAAQSPDAQSPAAQSPATPRGGKTTP
jgi:hypothetical protein